MSAPAKRKNMATTADGAQYNKRQRPDNFSAMLAMPPPPRPSPRPVANTDATPEQEKVVPPHARRSDWKKWTHKGPTKSIESELANDKKPDSAAQDTQASAKKESASEAVEDEKVDAVAGDVNAGATVSGAEDNNDDRETTDNEPGSPVDEPDTHFATFTPMGQRKTLYKRAKDDYDGYKAKKNNDKEPRRNPVYGQTNAFPVLDEEEENSENEVDLEALRYLRQVMTEANGLPTTFSGPVPDDLDIYEADDVRGFYEDGAYIARTVPAIGPVMPPGYKGAEASNTTEGVENSEDDDLEGELVEDEDFNVRMVDAQEEYHSRLLLRFESFRKLLAQEPPEANKTSLRKSHWITFPMHAAKAMRQAVRHWLKVFAEEPPHPVQIAQMDSYCVLQLLDILKRKLECFKDVDENISIWLFALLARLAEVLPIYCDEASVVRELALRALMVRVTFTGEHVPELENKVPGYYAEDKDFFEHVDADPRQSKKQQEKNKNVFNLGVEELKKQLQEQKEFLLRKDALMKRVDAMPVWESKRVAFGLEPRDASDSEEDEEKVEESPAAAPAAADSQEDPDSKPNSNANTRTTLDMILTVACEVWGQKDLSKYMEMWGEHDYDRPSEEEKEVLRQMDEENSRPSLPPMLSPIGSPVR